MFAVISWDTFETFWTSVSTGLSTFLGTTTDIASSIMGVVVAIVTIAIYKSAKRLKKKGNTKYARN